jgi:hypothetical protein
MQYEFREIKISLLREDPKHFHREPAESQTEILGQSITSVGLIHPIVVRRYPRKGNYYGVIGGWNRVLAALKNGDTTIWAKVMKNCPDALAAEISLRENMDRFQSEDDERRGLAELTQYFTKEEQDLRAHQPDGDGTRKPGRPPSPENIAIQKVAAISKKNPRTIKRKLKREERLAPDTTDADEGSEIDSSDTEYLNSVSAEKHGKDDIAQAFATCVAALHRFRMKYVDDLMDHLRDATPEAIAHVDESDISLLEADIQTLTMLLARAQGRDLRDETESAQESGASDTALDADALEEASNYAPAVEVATAGNDGYADRE